MTIGTVTLSVADWLASRVSDRMALVAAGQNAGLSQQTGAKAVPPAEENSGAQLERRQRERAAMAAQESYKRVAARIKSRLTNPSDPRQAIDPASLRVAKGHDAALEGLRDSPRIVATLIAAEQRAEVQPANSQASRSDPLFALVETGQKKTQTAAEKSQDDAREIAVVERALELEAEKRELIRTDADLAALTHEGLWDDLFVDTSHLSTP